jgi:hypothetical protein
MTIVAGFLSGDVMLLCADMEEGDGYSKREVKKIAHFDGNGWQVDVGGSGPSAVLDLTFKKLKKEFAACSNRDEMASDHEEIIRSVLQKVHEQYIWPSKVREYAIELLVGINLKDSQEFCLYRTQEYIPQPIESFCCIGLGAILGNYFASVLHSPSLTRTQMLYEGAFIIEEVREFVSDCGKGTQIELTMKDGRHWSFGNDDVELSLPNRLYIADSFWEMLEPWEIQDDYLQSWITKDNLGDYRQKVVWKDFDRFPDLRRA